MALPPVNGKPKGPIRIPATPKQAPTGPTAPTTTLPDPIERNKTISVRPAGATGSADVLERNIEFKLEEERLASAEGRAKELGIPVPAGTGLEKYKDSPYFKETTSTGQIVFTSPKTGKDIYYNPETGLVPGLENYGVSRDFIMDNLPEDPIERNAVLDWLEESDKEGGKIDLSTVGLRGRRLSAWAQTVMNPLALLQIPQKTIVAGIEQLTNIPSGTASLKEMEQDVLDPTYGFGSFVGDVTGNKWLDRAIGLAGDIFTDPTNLLLPGGSQIADVTLTGATKIAADDAVKLFVNEAGETVLRAGADDALRAVGVSDDIIETLSRSASDIRVAKDAIGDAIKVGDQGAIATAKAAEDAAQSAFNQAASEIAKVAKVGRGGKVIAKTGKAGRIISAEGARAEAFASKQFAKQTLDAAIASGDNTAIAAAQTTYDEASKLLDDATEKLVSQGNIKGVPVRKYGEQARLALADRIKQIRAKAIVDAADTNLDAGTRISAQAVADTLTDANIAKVATEGWSAIRGDLAEALGTKGGVRFGTKRFNKRIPGSGTVSDAIGAQATRGRLKLQDLVGDKFLSAITPVAKSGPVDPETILQMRTALRTGKAGNDAVNFLNIISFNDAVVRARSLSTSRANIVLNSILKRGDTRIADSIVPYLSMPQSEWLAAGLATPSRAQLDLIERVRGAMDFWYDEANSLHKALGNIDDLPRVDNYFPLVQTDVFSDWATRNPIKSVGVGQTIEPTVVDPTWIATNFMERTLVPGKVWFGTVLTAEDLAGGPARLNQIAQASGVFGKRNIKVFEERLVPAISAYANKHARYIAFGRTVLDITNPLSSYLDTFRRTIAMPFSGVSPKTLRDVDNLEATVNALFTPSRLQDWSMDDINEVLNKLSAINDTLDDAVRVGNVTPINAERFREAIADVENYVNEINRAIRSGDYPENLVPLALHELDNFAMNALNDVQEIGLKAMTLPDSKWKDVINVVETGFEVLNSRTIPNITARNEVYEILTNVRKLKDPGVASELSQLAGAYQQWWKSWVLATPRYVRRNAFSDAFQILLAGADVRLARKSLKLWREFIASGKSIEEFALTLPGTQRQMFLEAASSIPSSAQIAGTFSAGNVAAKLTGGRPTVTGTGEIGGEVLAGAGMFGAPATGRLPILGRYGIGPESKLAAKTSRALGYPIDFTRTIATNIGDAQRFILTYDGLAKGLSLQESIVRTNKYLIDYASTSKFDDIVKRTVMPFWMFASRNLPMQYENMLMHPKIFNRYNYIKRFLEAQGEDREPYDPLRGRQAGAFQLDPDITKFLTNPGLTNPFGIVGLGLQIGYARQGGRGFSPVVAAILGSAQGAKYAEETGRPLVFTPDLGFTGGGRPNELLSLPKEVLSLFGLTAPETGASSVLSQLPAPLRAFLELAVNRKFYSKDDLINEYSKLSPQEQSALYFISQTVPQLSWLGQVPPIREAVDVSGNEALAQALGIPLTFTAIPEGEPGSEEARILRAREKAQKQERSFYGNFVLPFTEADQIAEIARRRRVLEELIAQEEK